MLARATVEIVILENRVGITRVLVGHGETLRTLSCDPMFVKRVSTSVTALRRSSSTI